MFKIGISKDIHRLEEGYKLILGGVTIPFTKGVVAHSDGDILIHAICEAIIGALGLGDIGKHFPDNDEKYRNISSRYFLTYVNKKLKENNYKISNIDSSIILEKPILKDYINQMKLNIAIDLEIDPSLVNIKATRGEGLGYVGSGEGLEAICVVLIEK